MTDLDDGEADDATTTYPLGCLPHLAELLGALDEFLRSGTEVTTQLTMFLARRGHTHPGFSAGNVIDDLSFTAHHIRCLVDRLHQPE